jgi:F-type H+-transporting ATPase subunit a
MRVPMVMAFMAGVLAFLAAGSVRAEAEDAPAHPAPEPAKESTHADAKHGEPDAIEHVMDEIEHWDILHNNVFGFSIPIGWFTVRGKYYFPTKFMILELLVAVLIWLAYSGLAARIENGDPPRGPFWNFLEWMLLFIRDQIARPTIGEHDADKYLPFLWTLGLFILFNNLLGMIPWMGSPTANVYVTGALALCSFILMHGAAIAKMGFFHYVRSLWPHIDLPPMFGIGTVFGFLIKLMIFVIELLGTVIKSFVLAVRLFANMFAGHVVLATILLFIIAARNLPLLGWGSISLLSVLGVVALSLLELFVAFLQAYLFVFLTSLFTGMALHPQH